MEQNPALPIELSVIIPASGRPDLLVRCLASLAADRIGTPFETCVVDDGSGLDEQAIRKAASVSYPLQWISGNVKRGRSAARNDGVETSRGRIVVFLDADMEVRPGFLATHIAVHRESPRIAAIGRILWPKGGSFLRYIGSRGIAKLKPGDTVPPWYFMTGNASVERADLPSLRPFDETLAGWGGEDLDLGLRLAGAGVRFTAARDAVARHHFTGSFREHLARTSAYGLAVLPVLAARHPEIMHITRLERLSSPLRRFLVGDICFRPAGFLAEKLDFLPLPDALFDYLTYTAYARGWMEGTRR